MCHGSGQGTRKPRMKSRPCSRPPPDDRSPSPSTSCVSAFCTGRPRPACSHVAVGNCPRPRCKAAGWQGVCVTPTGNSGSHSEERNSRHLQPTAGDAWCPHLLLGECRDGGACAVGGVAVSDRFWGRRPSVCPEQGPWSFLRISSFGQLCHNPARLWTHT